MIPEACFLLFEPAPWDLDSEYVSASGKGPPSLKQLKGYALSRLPQVNGEPDLTSIPEKVIIVDRAATMNALGLHSNPFALCGVYQSLSSGHHVVFLPWGDKDKRRKRSEMWRQYFVHAVNRACLVARGAVPEIGWGICITGQGADAVEALEAFLSRPEPLAVDVETVGDMPDMQITAIGFASDTVSVSIPWAGYHSKVFGQQSGLQSEHIRRLVASVLAHKSIPKVFHNGGFDRAVFASLGMPCLGDYEDTILQMKIVFPELYRNLQFSAGMAGLFDPWKDHFKGQRKKVLGQHQVAIKALKKSLGLKDWKVLEDWSEIPIQELLEYNCKDAAATIRLWRWLVPRVAKTHCGAEKYDKLRFLADMAADQWLYGVAIDFDKRNAFMDKAKLDLAELVRGWTAIVGPGIPPYGPGSGEALQKLFFDMYKAPVKSRSKETDEPSLNTFSLTCWETEGRQPLSDAAFMLFRIRKLQKAMQAFLGPITSNRVFAQPNVTGTVGTRFSYKKPNLQQWAKAQAATRFTTGEEFALAPNIRELVVAEPGCILLEADYNALEARANGYRTANDLWFEWMRKDQDMHVQHVKLMYGVRLHRKGCKEDGCSGGEEYCLGSDKRKWADKDGLRQITKVVTYNRFYNKKGTSAAAVKMLKSKMPKLTEEDLDEIYALFDAAIPNVANWHISANRTDRENGYIETGAGGWRLPVGKKPDDNRNRSFEIQSTVGDIVCQAMIDLAPKLDKARGQRMLFQVHDAFVLQCLVEDAQEVGRKMKVSMEKPIPLLWGYQNVVLPVDIQWGPSWAAMKRLELQ